MKETYEVGPGQAITVTIEVKDAPDTEERRYTDREVASLQASEAELVSAPLRRELEETKRELARRTEEREEREAARARLERELDQERHRRARDLDAVESQRDHQIVRVRELERLLALAVAREDALEIKVRGLIGDLGEANSRIEYLDEKVRLYDIDRNTERDRADKNREWAERAELRVAQMAQEKREALASLADQLGKVIGAVHGHEVSTALQRTHYESGWEYQTMANAIRNVRRVVGSPSLPATADGPTSQA